MSDKSNEEKTDSNKGYSTAGLAEQISKELSKLNSKTPSRYTPLQRKAKPTEFDGGRKSKKSRKFKKSRKSKKSKSKKYFIYM